MAFWESNGLTDEWYTPKYVFDALGCRFDLDVAAPVDRRFVSVPAEAFLTADSLTTDWEGFCWMNPPFGGRNGLVAWLDKMATHNHGIALTPDRSSAPWWQQAARRSSAVLFVAGKIRFVRPDGSEGKSPSTGTSLFAFGQKAASILQQASHKGLGACMRR